MAVFGQGINPALGRIDYTPYAQGAVAGAQGIAQGIAGLGAGVSQGVKSYLQNKQSEKEAQGLIKAADKLSSGFEPILEKVDPKIAKTLQDLRTQISDPNISTVERATAAKAFMEQAPTLLNAGVRFLETQATVGARTAELTAKQAELDRKRNIASAARSIALGQPLTQTLSPDDYNEAVVQAANLREKAQMTERVDVQVAGKTTPVQRTTNLLTGKVTESQIREPYMGARETLEMKSREKLMDIGVDEIKKLKTEVSDASAQADLADQILYALEQGATAGPFAEASATVKNVAESIFGQDYNATVQKLYTQGVQGLSKLQLRALAKGLGSMSNDDRVDFQKGFLNIKDPKQAVRYYAEVARLNKERADTRQAFVSELLAGGATLDQVDSQLSKLKKEEPFISAIARQNVFGAEPPKSSGATPATSSEKPLNLSGLTLEQIQAELARRKTGGG